jgi:hypothetical protein
LDKRRIVLFIRGGARSVVLYERSCGVWPYLVHELPWKEHLCMLMGGPSSIPVTANQSHCSLSLLRVDSANRRELQHFHYLFSAKWNQSSLKCGAINATALNLEFTLSFCSGRSKCAN